MFYGRCNDVRMLKSRCNNAVLTWCAGWLTFSDDRHKGCFFLRGRGQDEKFINEHILSDNYFSFLFFFSTKNAVVNCTERMVSSPRPISIWSWTPLTLRTAGAFGPSTPRRTTTSLSISSTLTFSVRMMVLPAPTTTCWLKTVLQKIHLRLVRCFSIIQLYRSFAKCNSFWSIGIPSGIWMYFKLNWVMNMS